MTTTTTNIPTLRESFAIKLAEATEKQSNALKVATENNDLEIADSLIAAYLEAKAEMALVQIEGQGLFAAEAAEKFDADLVKKIKAVFKAAELDPTSFSFDTEKGITWKSKTSRTGGEIGQRSTLTVSVNGAEALGIIPFMKQYGYCKIRQSARIKGMGKRYNSS